MKVKVITHDLASTGIHPVSHSEIALKAKPDFPKIKEGLLDVLESFKKALAECDNTNHEGILDNLEDVDDKLSEMHDILYPYMSMLRDIHLNS